MIINNKSIQEKLFKSGGSKQKILQAAEVKINRKLSIAKKRLLDKIQKHVVSIELEGGPFADNSSQTLGGYGNLFSFIGFPSSAQPVNDLLSLLDEGIDITKLPSISKSGNILFSISIPSRSNFDTFLSLPWEYGRSWPHAIEEGIGNLGHFLNRVNMGRSLGGVQVESTLSAREFAPINFITPLLKEFELEMKS